MKLIFKGPILALTGGVLGALSGLTGKSFLPGANIFLFVLGIVLFLIGFYMILNYHKSEEYRKSKENQNKQPWEP